MTAVKRPRIRRPEFHWPTPSQLTALIEASAGTFWEIPFLLSAVTGARRSEVLGLAWEDMDLRSATLNVRRSVQRMPGDDEAGTIAFTPLKTKRARRLVQLPAFALDRIRSHRRQQLERRTVLERGGKIRRTRKARRWRWFASAAMVPFFIPTRSPTLSRDSDTRRGCIPRPDFMTSVMRSPPSSDTRESMA